MTFMNSITPAAQQSPVMKPAKGKIYNWANKFFKAPASVDSWTKNGLAKDGSMLSGTRQNIRRFFGNRMKELVDYDYREFPALVLGKHHIPLSEPPKGALLLLLYPGTVIPRLYRAYQRGKQNNDYREMGDVLRRDLTAITLFVYALGPAVKYMNLLTEKLSGVKLLDPKSMQVLKYSQFKNYEIDSPRALKAILTEGNGGALVKAVNKLHDRGLGAKYGRESNEFQQLNDKITDIKDSVKDLVEKFELHNSQNAVKVWPTEGKAKEKMDELANTVFDHFNDAEKLRENALKAAKEGGSAEMVKVAEKMRGEFKGALQNAAKTHRLPSDVVSFAILVGAIGYLPMWFNTEWNKRQFEKKMAAKKSAEEKNQQPKASSAPLQTFQAQAVSKPSVPQQAGQPPLFGQPTPQPFGMLPAQNIQNPFSWRG